ncbi:MAG: T9SS type A sorting domain-containing protein [Saprospiraceae bacterium]|nr:T9SS type A sorting domain-containing protein [Saprospiraceae bacterium]
MKKLIQISFLFLYIALGHMSTAQMWENRYNTNRGLFLFDWDYSNSIVDRTIDGGFLAQHPETLFNPDRRKLHCIKFNQYGEEEWRQEIDNVEFDHTNGGRFYYLKEKAGGGYYSVYGDSLYTIPTPGTGTIGNFSLDHSSFTQQIKPLLREYDQTSQLTSVVPITWDTSAVDPSLLRIITLGDYIQTSNGNYLISGLFESRLETGLTINIVTVDMMGTIIGETVSCERRKVGPGLLMVDPNGNEVWHKIYEDSTVYYDEDPAAAQNSISRYIDYNPSTGLYERCDLSPQGFDFEEKYQQIVSVLEYQPDQFVFVTQNMQDWFDGGSLQNKEWIYALDNQGEKIWSREKFIEYNDRVRMKIHPNGNLLLTGEMDSTYLFDMNTGNTIWSYYNNGYDAFDVLGTNDGSSYLVQYSSLIRLDASGNEMWSRSYTNFFLPQHDVTGFSSLIASNDDHIIMLGGNRPSWTYEEEVLMKVDSTGRLYPNTIEGTIFRDSITDCIQQTQEIGLKRVGLLATHQNTGDTYYTVSDNDGSYYLEVDTGYYDVQIFHNYLFFDENPNCTLGTIGDTLSYTVSTVDVPMEAAFDCPLMVVDVGTPVLRPCQPSKYTVSYHNYGTVDADDVEVWVSIDSYLTIDSTSLPIVGQQGDSILFDVGHVDWLDGGSFDIWVTVSCNAAYGQTHCVSASITPDTVCQPTPGWDGADIRVNGWCDGDTARFEIENVGQSMNASRSYLVIEENIINMTNNYQLAGGDQLNLGYNTNGLTYRVEAEQTTGHPWALKSSATVYGCGANPVVSFAPSIYFDNDASPFYSLSCQQNSYYNFFNKANTNQLANDKQGYPLGYGSNNAIDPGQVLEYKIRFQNTGTDSVSKVVVIDTLASTLDPTTILMGAASHPYTWTIHTGGILEVEFDPIALPDSTTNEVASHGFVKFKIGQNPTNPIGTVIENNAAISYDYGAPVMTNTTFHTVDTGYIQVDLIPDNGGGTNSVNELDGEISYQVIPNPFQTSAMIQVQGVATQDMYIEVYNALGQQLLLLEDQDGNGQFPLHKADLSSGVHFFSLKRDGEVIQSGRFIVQ